MEYPVIDLKATGENIARLRKERGITVRQIQEFFGFCQPQAIYKWQRGDSLPSVDNLYALSRILNVPMQEILVESGRDFVVLRNTGLRRNGNQVYNNEKTEDRTNGTYLSNIEGIYKGAA